MTIDNFEPIEFENKITLIIGAGAGDDAINLHNPGTPTGLTGITVNGDDPSLADTITVNGISGTTDHFVVRLTAAGQREHRRYSTRRANYIAPAVHYSGMQGVNVVGQNTDARHLGGRGNSRATTRWPLSPARRHPPARFAGFASGFSFGALIFNGITGWVAMGSGLVDLYREYGPLALLAASVATTRWSSTGRGPTIPSIGTRPSFFLRVSREHRRKPHTPIALGGDGRGVAFVSHVIARGLDGNDTFNVVPGKNPNDDNFDIRIEETIATAFTDTLNLTGGTGRG